MPEILLSPLRDQDVPQLVALINDPAVEKNTLTIPFPYRKEDALAWLDRVQEARERHGDWMNWAIREREEGPLLGSIGLMGHDKPGTDEVGYWLGRPFRGQGIMPRAIELVASIAAGRGIERLQAKVFTYNEASRRALEKSGFRFLRVLPHDAVKHGQPQDVWLLERQL
jgi:RimJ/RimL family protein N-acetyltransferase